MFVNWYQVWFITWTALFCRLLYSSSIAWIPLVSMSVTATTAWERTSIRILNLNNFGMLKKNKYIYLRDISTIKIWILGRPPAFSCSSSSVSHLSILPRFKTKLFVSWLLFFTFCNICRFWIQTMHCLLFLDSALMWNNLKRHNQRWREYMLLSSRSSSPRKLYTIQEKMALVILNYWWYQKLSKWQHIEFCHNSSLILSLNFFFFYYYYRKLVIHMWHDFDFLTKYVQTDIVAKIDISSRGIRICYQFDLPVSFYLLYPRIALDSH